MKIEELRLEPLSSKHYSTDITVKTGNGWDKSGPTFTISLSGMGTKPSVREYEKGYGPDDGMNHVESEELYELATIILEALRKHL